MRQRPFASSPSSAAKQAGESKRGNATSPRSRRLRPGPRSEGRPPSHSLRSRSPSARSSLFSKSAFQHLHTHASPSLIGILACCCGSWLCARIAVEGVAELLFRSCGTRFQGAYPAEGLAVAVAAAVALAAALALAVLAVAVVGPALIVRVTGAPGFAGAPAVEFVRMAVSGALRLVSVSMAATSKPAPEMVLAASSRLRPDTSGIVVSSSRRGPP
jgi:hypothetical protein